MAVRNFWIEASIDGCATNLEGGPRAKDGEFTETIYIRDNGGIETAVRISGQVDADGGLAIYVQPAGGVTTEPYGQGFAVRTKR